MSYVIGNLIGRLLMSAFLVWIVMLVVNRFSLSKSLKNLFRPLPILITFTLFLLGLASNAIANTQTDNHEKQFFSVATFPKVNVRQIYIPADPHWHFEADIQKQIKKITLTPQVNTDIKAVIELAQHAFIVPDDQYQTIRDSITETIGRSLNSPLEVVKTSNNHLNSISYQGRSNSNGLSLRHQLDVFRINQRIWTFHSVVSVQSDESFQVLRRKIFKSIRLSNSLDATKG